LEINLKRLLSTSSLIVVALFVAASAGAQDFKGFYFGGYLGGDSGRSNATTSTVFSATGYFAASSVPAIASSGAMKFAQNSFNGGGQVGYNYVHSHWLVGVESDLGYMHLNAAKTITTVYPCCGPTTFTITQSIKTDGLFTLRPRFGLVWNHLLIYATGGLAMTGLHYQEVFTDTFATAAENANMKSNRVGYSAGGGIEYALSHHVSVKGEYLYNGFGTITTTRTNLTTQSEGTVSWPMNIFTHTAYLRAQVYRGGVNFRF
jgi:outer membrane immunogenic protein